jgi:hypothetical protein
VTISPGREQQRSLLPAVALALGTLLLALPLRAEDFAVRTRGDRVSLKAVAVPLPDLLEALARETGLEVVWSLQPPPRPLVTVTLDEALSSDAVPSILAGLRFSYALGLDATGRQARTLYIVDGTPPAPTDPAEGAWPAPWRPARKANAGAGPGEPRPGRSTHR